MTDRIDELEKTVDQLVRRARAHDEFMAYLDSRQIEPSVRDKRNAILADYGVKPFREPPATTGLRFGAEIVERDDGGLDVMHGDRYLGWTGSPRVYRWQTPFYPEDNLTGNFDTRDAALSALASAPAPPGWVEPPHAAPVDKPRRYGARFIEHTLPHNKGTGYIRSADGRHELYNHGAGLARWTDNPESGGTFDESVVDEWLAKAEPPPGWVEPKAAPAPEKGEGDGKPEGAPADRTRLTLYPAKMCDSTRAAFDWISRHDGGAHGALFTRTLSDACAEYAASATAALARERDALRAELATVKAENERLKVAATPQPQRWFVPKGIDHRNGTHLCWRFNADGTGGRHWYDGKDDAPSAYTLAECIADKGLTEISPTTFDPVKKPNARKKKPAAKKRPATRKKARGK